MPSTPDERPDADVMVLEPTMTMELADLSLPASRLGGPPVAMVEGSLASLAGEIGSLRRRRLAAAALFLFVAFAVVLMWQLVGTDLGPAQGVTRTTLALRGTIAAAVAALLLSRAALTRTHVRLVEYALFGSLTLLMAIGQYAANVDLLRAGEVHASISVIKNGVFGTVLLMIIYGMFIPNDPVSTAKVVLSMALVHVVALTLVFEQPELAATVERLRTAEHAGSNVLFLMIGAALAIYGAYLLNGLRSDLHEARKFGQYQLRKLLGIGGMGEVYLAEHQLLKRPCALKLIKPEAGANPVALARFEREVQSAARLAHPNTIEIYDYGHTEDGTFYYVMEYLRGMSLSDLVSRSGPLPPGRVVYLFRQVCAGLSEAHTLGLVHRDLKPGNLFIAVRGGESDVAKVLDFGLVKLTHDPGAAALTSEMTVSGTPMYMAPEQATGEPGLDTRADIYALGAMMYFALTGKPPFTGDSAFAVMMAHARDPVVPPSQRRSEVPADLEQVVLRCLAKKPEDRYHTVKALEEALAACACATEWNATQADSWWTAAGFGASEESPPIPTENESEKSVSHI
jgi:serine/threonine-protein kinase